MMITAPIPGRSHICPGSNGGFFGRPILMIYETP